MPHILFLCTPINYMDSFIRPGTIWFLYHLAIQDHAYQEFEREHLKFLSVSHHVYCIS